MKDRERTDFMEEVLEVFHTFLRDIFTPAACFQGIRRVFGYPAVKSERGETSLSYKNTYLLPHLTVCMCVRFENTL